MSGLFITFEGTEGCGKSTQISRLAERLRSAGRAVRQLREPGGTPIGEEIRHTLKHSQQNQAMTPEAELLLMSASRAQLVREVIRPALAAGEVVLCDRFYDSTIAYQGYGRGLDLKVIQQMTDFAVGETKPRLTFFLSVPIEISEVRRLARNKELLQQQMLIALEQQKLESKAEHVKLPFSEPLRDRMEEADRSFFDRVIKGFQAVAAIEANRVKTIDATAPVEAVGEEIWRAVQGLL